MIGTIAMTTVPRRTALYMPGANARALEKAKTLPADALIFDLEDAVAPDAKSTARAQILSAMDNGGFPGREVVIRVNGPDTSWFAEDMVMVAKAKPDAVLVPKVEAAETITRVRTALRSEDVPAATNVWAMIETPMGVLNVGAISAMAKGPGGAHDLACYVVGLNDLVKETRAELNAERTSALYWLSATLTAARAHGIDVLDSVYNAHKDLEGFEAECLQGRMLGMDGKSLIHPAQIEIANRVFAPDEAEVAWARKILAAFEQPDNAGKGVISLDGKMVELLHAEMAKRTVAIADAIAARATEAAS